MVLATVNDLEVNLMGENIRLCWELVHSLHLGISELLRFLWQCKGQAPTGYTCKRRWNSNADLCIWASTSLFFSRRGQNLNAEVLQQPASPVSVFWITLCNQILQKMQLLQVFFKMSGGRSDCSQLIEQSAREAVSSSSYAWSFHRNKGSSSCCLIRCYVWFPR